MDRIPYINRKEYTMYYGNILYYDTANGLGVRTTLFVSGCRHHCKGCFNEMTWNFTYGHPYTEDIQDKILKSLDNPICDGLTILGGEPFEPENQPCIADLVTKAKQNHPDKSIWIYSGYLWEELNHLKPSRCYTDDTSTILSNTDILVDGEFIFDQRNFMLNFRGSENQRIIEVAKSLNHINQPPVLSDLMTAPSIIDYQHIK